MSNQQPSRLSNPVIAASLALLCTVLWGSAFPVVKIGYELLALETGDIAGKMVFAGSRFTVSGLIVLVFHMVSRLRKAKTEQEESIQNFKSLTTKVVFQILLLGILQTTIHYLFHYIGISFITGAKSSIVNTLTVFFAAIFSHFVYKNDKISVRKGIGLFIGFTAVVLVNLDADFQFSFLWYGEGFIVLSSLFSAISSMYSKRISKTIQPVFLAGCQLLSGGLFLFIIGLLSGGTIHTGNWVATLLFIYLALLSSLVLSIWTSLLKYNRVSSVTVFNFNIPIAGTLLSGLFLRESIFSIQYLIALPSVALGIYLVNSAVKKSDVSIKSVKGFHAE